MNTQQAAVALRFIIVAAVTGVDGDSLDQLSSYELPDGMLVSVISTQAIYRLDKLSTLTPGIGGPAIVAPGAGPGNFLLQVGFDDLRAVQVTGTAALTGATAETDDTWIALPAGSNFYALSDVSGFFSLNPTTGIVTYSGPPGRYKLSVKATIASAVAAQSVEIIPSVNGGFLGTTTYRGYAGIANVSPTTPGLGSQVSSDLITSLATADTVQAAARDTSASNNITVSQLSLICSPA
jgi:hypothetical protein